MCVAVDEYTVCVVRVCMCGTCLFTCVCLLVATARLFTCCCYSIRASNFLGGAIVTWRARRAIFRAGLGLGFRLF